MRLSCRTQVIAPKRETGTFLFELRVKFDVVAGGFALDELRLYAVKPAAVIVTKEYFQVKMRKLEPLNH
jgi:hypothetical protein